MAVSPTQIEADAKLVAAHEVAAFVLHDKKRYDEAGIRYGEAYVIIDTHRPLLLQVGSGRSRAAGTHKIGVLQAYDHIVEDPSNNSYSHPGIETHSRYGTMVHHVTMECREFGIPLLHGLKRIDWYRKHADWVKPLTGTKTSPTGHDHLWVLPLIESDRALVEALTGNTDLHFKTSPFLIECVYHHDHRRIHGLDEHDPRSIEQMEKTYAQYLALLFEHMH